MYTTISTSMLQVGAVLGSPIYDSANTKLLGAGVDITNNLLDRLKQRGIYSVVISDKDLARLAAYQPQGTSRSAIPDRSGVQTLAETPLTSYFDRAIERGLDLQLKPQADPFLAQVQSHAPVEYSSRQMTEFLERHEASVEELDGFYGALTAGKSADVSKLRSISGDALDRAADDLDLFVCLGINPVGNGSVSRHSMHVAMLAMSIGATMGLEEQTLHELGGGCLVHDVGMLHVKQQLFQAKRVLDPTEFAEIAKHPVATFELLQEHMDQVPAASRMVAYQMHERCDGSGYPRARTAERIHDLAKIAGVADTFTALVSRRPHRPGMLPYYAIVKLLEDVHRGLYDASVVRALLNTVSLFPIGSYVELSDGRLGKVIRSNREVYDRPVVEAWNRSNLGGTSTLINLAEQPELHVIRALARLR
jgi:HD-GYP domain-containing protein (c-di-GMP phosphodiesterase class II)